MSGFLQAEKWVKVSPGKRCDMLSNLMYDLHLKLVDQGILSLAGSLGTTQKRTNTFFSLHQKSL
jgi:hypothetical protein